MNFTQQASGALSNCRSHHNPGQAEDKRQEIPSRRLARSRVLVVEDEFIIALEIQSNLEEAGATVVGPAFALEEALALAIRENLSAAILDLRLGRDSVAPVASVLAERHIPFIFYTAQPGGDPVRRAWPLTKTLTKPASGDEIVRAIAETIRTKH
jgi:chemotaxis family two-component system sensor kinase Cph1